MKVFNQSLNNVQWITTAYLLAVTLTIVLAAYLHRSFKFKSLIIAAGTASVIGGVICMLSNTLPVMLEVPRAKQGSFVGTAGMIVALAPSLGPIYGGICLAALNWRFNFIFTLPITIVFCIIAARFMSDNKAHRDHFNFSEYLLIVLALVALTLAVNNLSSGFASPLVWGGLLVTVISFVIYFKLAKQEGKAHIINISVLKNTGFNQGLLIYTFLQFIQISLTFVIPNLAQLGLKTSALTSGMLLLLGSLLSAFFGPVMGRLLDSQGFKKLFLIGNFLAMAGILLYIIFAQKLSIALIVIFHVMFMTGFSMMYNNAMTIGLQQLEVMHIAGSPYQGQSKQVVMGSQAAFIVLFIFTLLIFACVLRLIKRDKQGLVKN
ncbi:MFS transporter [Lactobacillus delbrueckii]|uniref:MFS transporter n=1 Tax=Lactobacillus delbrueckii TaxID=1584 RepID=UPI001E413B16|nr:MFS transporter [Lactobacillus delbrueckii]MCD5514626.1 MFS transporter [Lactobacillus delbrueckii subsp. lactis]